MRILVTGAGGFIGSHLTERLVADGHKVTALARYTGRDTYGWLDEVSGCRRERGDVRDAHFMFDLVRGHDAVYHLAALGSVPYSAESPQQFIDTNITGTLNVAKACLAHGARLIFASTSEVYGNHAEDALTEASVPFPDSVYAVTKLAAEGLLQKLFAQRTPRLTILRMFNTYGPRQSVRAVIPRIIAQALAPKDKDPAIRLGNQTTRDFVFVDDTVDALVRALKLPVVGPLNVATGVETSLSAVCALVSSYPVVYRKSQGRALEVWRLCGDSSRFRSLTGWAPKVSLADGLSLTVDWFSKRGTLVQENFI